MREHRFAFGLAVLASLLLVANIQAAESPAPAVQVITQQPATVNLGEPLTYKLVVKNNSTANAINVVLTSQVPSGAKLGTTAPEGKVAGSTISWGLGNLAGGQSKEISVTVTPTQKVDLKSCSNVRWETDVCTSVKVTQPKLVITKTGPTTALKGDRVDYTVKVTNTGDGPAHAVVLSDKLPSGLKHVEGKQEFSVKIGDLPPGESQVVQVPCVAAEVGDFCNEATVKGKDLAPVTAQACTKVVEPKLAITKTGPKMRYLGRVAKFDITVSNPGTAPATNVRVVDPVPAGTEYVSSTAGGVYNATTNTVTWNLGTLDAGKSQKLSVSVRTLKIQEFCNVANASADRSLTASAKACTVVKGIPAILLELIDIEDPVEIGAETTYVITVTNQGSLEDKDVTLTIIVPEGEAFVSASGPVNHKIAEKTLTFAPLPELKPKAVATYRVVIKGTKSGDWRFKVALNSRNIDRPVNEEESTHVYSDE